MMNNEDEKYSLINLEKSFILFIEIISKIDSLKYKELSFNEKFFPLYLKYTQKIINSYIIHTSKIKSISSKKKLLLYKTFLNKLLKNKNIELKYKTFEPIKQNIIGGFFIAFIFNLLNNFLLIVNKEDKKEQIYHIKIINQLLNEILNIVGKLYIDKNINDDYFEFLLKLLIIFSVINSLENIQFQAHTKYELKNIIFFKSSINLIKNVFNNIIELHSEFTEKQENIINNIILFFKENIIDSYENTNKNNYINKIFLSKNEYKIFQLLDLIPIISNLNSKKNQIIQNFTEFLTNIYNFNFGYENLMCPMLRLLEPFFINNSKKNAEKIKKEINISDFPLLLLDSLINYENKILSDKNRN